MPQRLAFSLLRAEDLGHASDQLRRTPWWFWPLAPLAVLSGACAYPLSKFIGAQTDKRIQDPCFTSTFKVSAGMFLPHLPVYSRVATGMARDR